MPRYVSILPRRSHQAETGVRRPVSAWDDDEPAYRAMTVHDDLEPVETGLLDQHGVAIYRLRAPVGFGRE